MLRTDRLCVWIFIIAFAMFIPSFTFLKFIDELCTLLLIGVAFLDCAFNRCWRRYRPLWIVIAVMAFYIIYSLKFVSFNTPKYILVDSLICLKPLVTFLVMYIVAPVLTESDKRIIAWIAAATCIFSGIVLLFFYKVIFALGLHPLSFGVAIFMSVLMYIYSSQDVNGVLCRKSLYFVIIALVLGLLCGRSKYFGEFMLAMFMLLFYRRGMFRKMSWKSASMVTLLLVLIIAVSYNKISYYFIQGVANFGYDDFQGSFARPVLYVTSFLIMCDYFPFGSGLASFASFPSQVNYSELYYEYGLDKVWGLSPDHSSFINDAFYPMLAQFGVVGLVLYIVLFVFIYRTALRVLVANPRINRYNFICVVLSISFIMIEGVGGTEFVKSSGMLVMALCGMICGMAHTLKSHDEHTVAVATDLEAASPSIEEPLISKSIKI